MSVDPLDPLQHREMEFLRAVLALLAARPRELVRARKVALQMDLAYDDAITLVAALARRDLVRGVGDPRILSQIRLTVTRRGKTALTSGR